MPLPGIELLPSLNLFPGDPILTSTASQRLYAAITPLMKQDADNGNAGQVLCSGFAAMLDPVVFVVSDAQDGDLPGWAPVFDPIGNPGWLDWMGQFVGVRRPVGLSDVGMATLVQHPTGFNRGSVESMIVAMQATLTGNKTVLINVRVGGQAFVMTAATYTSETPDPQTTLLALQSQMPAWMRFTYSTVVGGTYAVLAASHASYTLMEAAHTFYSDIPVNPAA